MELSRGTPNRIAPSDRVATSCKRADNRGDANSRSDQAPTTKGLSQGSPSAVQVQQHRIAVAEEAVALVDRVRIQRADVLEAGERADQHQQRALRQVEVGDQHIDDAKRKARRDEDVGVAAAGLQRAAE